MESRKKKYFVKKAGEKGNGLYATEGILKNEVIFEFVGKRVSSENASVMALQIEENVFLESTLLFDDNLNHSCNPNGYIRIDEDGKVFLEALRDIKKNEELSFDYCTTEWDLIEQKCDFICQCGSENCRHEIKGFKYLSTEEKLRIKDICLPYLQKKI